MTDFFAMGWNDWVESRGEWGPAKFAREDPHEPSSKDYMRGWRGAQEAARSGIAVEKIGSPAYKAALKQMRAAGIVKNRAGKRKTGPRKPTLAQRRARVWERCIFDPETHEEDLGEDESDVMRVRCTACGRYVYFPERGEPPVGCPTCGADLAAQHDPEDDPGAARQSNPHMNRAGGKKKKPRPVGRKSQLTAPTRVATLTQLGHAYDSSLFYSVKAGKIYARERTGGGGYGRGRLSKAKLLGTIQGFKRGTFYSVKGGVISARRRK